MIVDFLWVLLVALILLNFRQYRGKDTDTFQASLDALQNDRKKDTDALRDELFNKLSALEALLREPSGNTRNDRGDAYRELETLRGELAIIIDSQKRRSDYNGHSVSQGAAVNPETEREQTIHGN